MIHAVVYYECTTNICKRDMKYIPFLIFKVNQQLFYNCLNGTKYSKDAFS